MKKSKLIELLKSIPGDPEIKIWNGMVKDWMNISPEISKLQEVKPSFDAFQRNVKGSPINHSLSDEEMQKAYRKQEWSINDFVDDVSIKKGLWKRRWLFVLEAKLRGKSVSDRLGKINY